MLRVEDTQALRKFVNLPYELHRTEPFWVPPLRIAQKELLDTRKHPFYANAEMQCFLAKRDGKVVGRIAGIIDRNYNRSTKEAAGSFGFFESVDDVEVAEACWERLATGWRNAGLR